MECLWCFDNLIPEVDWLNVVHFSKPKTLCENCSTRLEKITGARCAHCSRQSEEKICPDCKWWQNHLRKDSLEFNYSIFAYNDFMQDVVAKWKYRGDYSLANAFADDFISVFRKQFSFLKNYLLVPIPLSEERLKERAFNQAQQLADFLPGETSKLLARAHGEKQSKKTRQERIASKNPFLATESIHRSVILVDDIYTTGTTLRHAANLLKEQGSPKVYAFTLIRG